MDKMHRWVLVTYAKDIDVFGETVHDHVGPEDKGRGIEGREEGVVNDEEDVMRWMMRYLGQARDIDQAEGRVCGWFGPYQQWIISSDKRMNERKKDLGVLPDGITNHLLLICKHCF